MSYFNLRKHAHEPELAEVEEEPAETVEEPDDGEVDEPSGRQYGPLLTGLFGPARWLTARFSPGAAMAVHGVAVWAILFYGRWIAVGIILVWLFTVALFVPREALDGLSARLEDRGSQAPAEVPAPSRSPGGREGALRLLYTVLGEAPGVHLRTVLAYLQEHGQWEGKTVADLRRHLEALGIPVKPKVKMDGTPTRGVLRADLDALPPLEETSPSPAPSPTV